MQAATLWLALLLAADSPTADDFPASARKAAIAATVRVAIPETGGLGSGVVVRRSGPHVYILTAAHVVGKARQTEVHVPQPGKAGKPRAYRGALVLAASASGDVAILRLPASAGLPEPVPLAPAAAGAKVPALALSVGWATGDAPTALSEVVRRKVLITRPGETTSVWCWETRRRQARGRSGGPLLSPAGRVIGLASGHDGEWGYYTHLEEIQRFLKRNGLGWLYEEEG
jgi:S1-C subfamily serine protease